MTDHPTVRPVTNLSGATSYVCSDLLNPSIFNVVVLGINKLGRSSPDLHAQPRLHILRWVLGMWVLGVWVLSVWVLGMWVLGMWVLGVWVLGIQVFYFVCRCL